MRAAHGGLQKIWVLVWAIAGALVVLYLFLLVLGALTPSDAPALAVVVLILAVAWLAHSWTRLIRPGGSTDRADRERRGF